MNKNIKPLELPELPRSVTGLKKNGKRDKRYKAGNTMAELKKYMKLMAGRNNT